MITFRSPELSCAWHVSRRLYRTLVLAAWFGKLILRDVCNVGLGKFGATPLKDRPFLGFQVCFAVSFCEMLSSASQIETGHIQNLTQFKTLYKARINVFPNDPRPSVVTIRKIWFNFVQLDAKACVEESDKSSLLDWVRKDTFCVKYTFRVKLNCKFAPKPQTIVKRDPRCKKTYRNCKKFQLPTCKTDEDLLLCCSKSYGKKMVRPFGQECILVVYYYAKTTGHILLNNEEQAYRSLVYRTAKNNVLYSFRTHLLFGVNLTFVKFHLADFFVRTESVWSQREFEFLLIRETSDNKTSFLFFMTRSKWSLHLGSKFDVFFRPCGEYGKLCGGKRTFIVFNYQIFDARMLTTESDNFHKVLDVIKELFQFGYILITADENNSNLCENYFLQGHKYEDVILSTPNIGSGLNIYVQIGDHRKTSVVSRHFHVGFHFCFLIVKHLNKRPKRQHTLGFSFHQIVPEAIT